MSRLSKLKNVCLRVAPFFDKYDVIFGLFLILVVLFTYLSYLPNRIWSSVDLLTLFSTLFGILFETAIRFMNGSGPVVILASATASIGLYKWRHRTDKKRPTVRETFEQDGDTTDFGLKNFGPGSALYIQIIVAVSEDDERLIEIEPHDLPVHLEEGEFLSLINEGKNDWLADLVDRYNINADSTKGESVDIDIYFTCLSRSSTRVPPSIPTKDIERRDEPILDTLIEEFEKPLSVELERIKNECL